MSARSPAGALALLASLLLAGCGYYDARAARDPLTSPLLRMTYPDLHHCMGPPDSWAQVDRDVFDLTWSRTSSDAAFKASIADIGSLQIGGGGGCKVNITVARDGQVMNVDFPGSYNNNLLAVPYEACTPLVSECLREPDSSGVSKGFDLGSYLGVAAASAVEPGRPKPSR